jgi:hypothetical protein
MLTGFSEWTRLKHDQNQGHSFSTSLASGEELTVSASRTDEGLLLEANLTGCDEPFLFRCMYHNGKPQDRELVCDLIAAGKRFDYAVPTPKLPSP